MRSLIIRILTLLLLMASGCTTEFIPEISNNKVQLVIEGLISDQYASNKVKLSTSVPVGSPLVQKPVKGAIVAVTDENGEIARLTEKVAGTYSTDSLTFRGRVGGKYSLKIKLNGKDYETDFIEMQPVPSIGALYYEKVVVSASDNSNEVGEGCKIYLDSYDPSGQCRYFRWEYDETWEYIIPYPVVNRVCWISDHSGEILVKNTEAYSQSRVTKFPLLFINNKTDKLKVKYSMLVKQYSINAAEYDFWEKIKNVSLNVGGLYDRTPVSVAGNVRCTTNPSEVVNGFFSVASVATERLFVKEKFLGQPSFYSYCATDTVYGTLPEEGLNTTYWVIEDYANEVPAWWVTTEYRECGDCTKEGTKVRPPFWDEDVKKKQ
jgi:hypothetical protein